MHGNVWKTTNRHVRKSRANRLEQTQSFSDLDTAVRRQHHMRLSGAKPTRRSIASRSTLIQRWPFAENCLHLGPKMKIATIGPKKGPNEVVLQAPLAVSALTPTTNSELRILE